MSDEEDPEVAADLALREHAAATRPRMSDAQFGRALNKAAAPAVIGVVPCRGRCGSVVDWTEEAEHAFDAFNRKLSRDREAPLDKTRIAFCNRCRTHGAKLSAENNRKQVDKLAELIRELKDEPPPRPDRERDIVEKIKALNHPDVDALVLTIREKRAKQPAGKRQRGSDLMR